MHSLRRALCQENIVRVGGRDTVVPGNKFSHCLAEHFNSKRVGIGTSTRHLVEVNSGPLGGIGVDALEADESGVDEAGEDLTIKGNGLLADFLRVANVAEGDLIEGIF